MALEPGFIALDDSFERILQRTIVSFDKQVPNHRPLPRYQLNEVVETKMAFDVRSYKAFVCHLNLKVMGGTLLRTLLLLLLLCSSLYSFQ